MEERCFDTALTQVRFLSGAVWYAIMMVIFKKIFKRAKLNFRRKPTLPTNPQIFKAIYLFARSYRPMVKTKAFEAFDACSNRARISPL